MESVAIIQKVLGADRLRREALELVAELDLPDCWIAAGFIRDAVWDHLHNHPINEPQGDVDVVWFCEDSPDADGDRQIEHLLFARMPNLDWSVKNQARMHRRNADRPYKSVADAMKCWPETATAIAARIDRGGSIEINAPLGLDDLITFQLRPGPRFREGKLPIFFERVSTKYWIKRYPKLEIAVSDSGASSRSD
ncbi:nucleotidyltransferase family protein [Novosphingobium aquimarinum]|uniref:nucleotidyltransferase family protein n=1 Tax=Novosphingobium aquimarinum TaxID=2682494 RepID=UPI0012EBBB2C|nr:nucleotidyltransferase family protein [Novosphingobium aquimarinum]